MSKDKNTEIPGHKNGHFISGVDTESNNHKDDKRFLNGKSRPDLDAIEAGDPVNNEISDKKYKENDNE
jgi:hypothetical protein